MFKKHEEQLQEKDCKLQSFLWCKVKVLSKSAISHAEMNMNWIWASYNSSVHHCGHCTIQPWLLSLRRAQRCVFEVSESIFEDVLGLLGVWRELGTGVAVNPEIGEKKTVGEMLLGGGFKHFSFSPLLGEMIFFVFQRGWNHHLGCNSHFFQVDDNLFRLIISVTGRESVIPVRLQGHLLPHAFDESSIGVMKTTWSSLDRGFYYYVYIFFTHMLQSLLKFCWLESRLTQSRLVVYHLIYLQGFIHTLVLEFSHQSRRIVWVHKCKS